MSLSPYYADDLNIFNSSEFPRELLNSPSHGEQYILVVGPDLLKWEEAHSHGHRHTYLGWLLEEIVSWCVQKDVIQQQDIIDELRTLLSNGALVPAGYKIEEYLAAQQQKQECLRAVLHSHNQVKEIHYHLARIPFRGFITTSYDTCIETAYTEIQHNQLHKFCKTSLSKTVEACRNKQPFILKLYGDLDDPDSIKLGHRLLTGLYAEDVREQLRQLFSEAPTIFIGFDDADGDLTVLPSLVKDGRIVHQRHSARVAEQVKSGNLIEISGYAESAPETLSHNEMLFAVRTPAHDTKATRQGVSPTPSTPADTEQDSQEESQQDHKRRIDVCIFYAPKDEEYKEEIEIILNGLKNKEGKPFEIVYMSWAMGESSGYTTDRKDPLMSKQLVILLISRSFLGSLHYNKKQMQKVVKRHRQRAWISPILVSACNWRGTQFDSLEEYILPKNKIPIAIWRSLGKDEGEAYLEISESLEKAFDYLAFC